MANEYLKPESFNFEYKSIGKTPMARLIKLSSAIEQWCQNRLDNINAGKAVEEFSIANVQALRKLIESEITLIKVDDANVVTDQILFLMVGAIKVQAQNNTKTTWPLVNQTIKSLIAPRVKYNNTVYFSLVSFVIIIGFVITIFSINNRNTSTTPLSSIEMSQEMPINKVGSEMVDSLINVYSQMQSGNCQLPQALLLQPQDREAFIAFVTEGKVNINTAESLKKSLSYADCEYPQKLMSNPLNILKSDGK